MNERIEELNPNDPKVYADPEKLRLLPPHLQMIGIINLAQSGKMVGSEVMTLEAILAGAGYQVTMDGQFSAEEQAALQNFEDKLNDKNFKEAATELINMVVGSDQEGKPLLPVFGQSQTISKPDASSDQVFTPAQTAAAKMMMKLVV